MAACSAPAPAPTSSPSPHASGATVTPAAAATGLGTCDELVEHVRASGGIGFTGGTELDPLCEWRVDDANREALGTPAAIERGVLSLRGAGLEREQVERTFRSKQREVARCAKNTPSAQRVLRARVNFDDRGYVLSTLADYRVELSDAARSCIEHALRGLRVRPTAAQHTQTVVYGFAAPAR